MDLMDHRAGIREECQKTILTVSATAEALPGERSLLPPRVDVAID